jgi:hypothetical protein
MRFTRFPLFLLVSPSLPVFQQTVVNAELKIVSLYHCKVNSAMKSALFLSTLFSVMSNTVFEFLREAANLRRDHIPKQHGCKMINFSDLIPFANEPACASFMDTATASFWPYPLN